MYRAMTRRRADAPMELLPKLDTDPAVKVVVITGAGDKAVCTGSRKDIRDVAYCRPKV